MILREAARELQMRTLIIMFWWHGCLWKVQSWRDLRVTVPHPQCADQGAQAMCTAAK